MSSLYTRIQESLVRDYEVVRLLTNDTLDKITSEVMSHIKLTMEIKEIEYTDRQITICIEETIRVLIAKGVEVIE